MSCTYTVIKGDYRQTVKNYLVANNAIDKFNNIVDFTKWSNLVGTINRENRERFGLKGNLIKSEDVGTQKGKKAFFDKALFDEVDAKAPSQERFQVNNTSEPENPELNQKMLKFFDSIGVKYESVDEILTPVGGAAAKADFLRKIVQVVERKMDASTLPEEAASFFVQILKQKNSPLYASMMSEIVKYKIYKDVKQEYAGVYQNEMEFKEEAIEKAIAYHLVSKNKNEEVPKLERLDRWWNKVLDWFKSLFNMDSESFDAYMGFDEASEELLNYEGDEQNSSFIGESKYQLSNSIQDAYDRLKKQDANLIKREIVENGKKIRRYFFKDSGKRIKSTVTEEVEKKKVQENIESIKTPEQDAYNNVLKDLGTRGHADIDNIITRWKEKQTGQITTPQTNALPIADYVKLEKFIHRMLEKDGMKGAIIEQEIQTYNSKDRGGTIDLLAIKDDIANLYDFKFQTFRTNKDGKVIQSEPDWKKMFGWNMQLSSYREDLKQLGFVQFGEMRIIPIRLIIKDGKFEGLEIDEEKDYLQPIPVLEERTGITDLDSLIAKLLNEYEKLQKSTPTTDDGRELRKQRLASIRTSVREIQTKRTVNSILEFGRAELKRVAKILKAGDLNEQELREAEQYVTFFRNLRDLDLANLSTVNIDVVKDADELWIKMKNELEKFAQKRGLSKTPMILSKYLDRAVSLYQQKNPIFQYFGQRVNQVWDKADREYKEFISSIEPLIATLPGEGLDKFNLMIDKEKGRLISKWSPEVEKARLDDSSHIEDYFEPKDIVTVNGVEVSAQDRFKEILDNKIEYLKELGVSQKQIDREVENYHYNFNVWTPKYRTTALRNRNGRYVKIKDKWTSDEYKRLEQNPNALALYNKFVELVKLAEDISDSGLPATFIPEVEKSLVRRLVDGGGIDAIAKSSIDELTQKDYESTYGIDGQRVYKIPLKYKQKVEDKSLDLGRVYSLFAHSVYMNKYLSEIEDETYLLYRTLEEGEFYDTKFNGEVVKDKSGNVQSFKADEETLGQFKDYVNHVMYGRRNSWDAELEVFGHKISVDRLRSFAQKYFSMATLGLHPFSAIGNLGGGLANLYSIAAKSKYFTMSDVNSSFVEMTSRSKKALEAIEYYDILSDETVWRTSRKISQDVLDKKYTLDWVYGLQRGGDWVVQNNVLISVLKNYGIVNGKLEKVELKDSLYKKSDLNVPEEIFNEVRNKVRGLNREIMGAMSERDVLLIQQSFMGALLLQFRRWMLPMGTARFGSMRYNQNLGEWEKGKYRTALRQVLEKNVGQTVKNLINVIPFAYGTSDAFNTRLEELWQIEKLKNPSLNISKEKFVSLYRENMRSTVGELAAYSMILAIIAGLKGDDDDDNPVNKFFVKGFTRTALELSFFWSSDSAFSMLKTPIPVLTLVTNFQKLTTDFIKEIYGTAFDEEVAEKAKPLHWAGKLVIGWNSLHQITDLFNDTERN